MSENNLNNQNKFYLKLARSPMAGLCNQIYALCGCIEYSISKNINSIYIDRFLMEINSDKWCPISDIIDINKLNLFLKQYNINVIDSFNSYELNELKNNYIESPILYFGTSGNPKLFTKILNNIQFLDKYIEIAKKIINFNDYNVIHLRLENDAVETYSKEMNIHPDVYKTINEERYIHCIKKYIDKNVMTVVLCSNENNNVIEYLKKNKYKFILTLKFFEYREINALIDLIIGTMCNTVFIGSYESSFSFTILNRILLKRKQDFLGFCIDLNKYYDFYRTYTNDNYTEYLNNNNIRELIYIPHGGSYGGY
jgi:glycerol-3-phosphate responsive antiterminator